MTFVTAMLAAAALLILLVLIGYVVRVERLWRRIAGQRVVTCPETGRPAGVRIDVAHAALTEVGKGEAELRLSCCSRWPQRGPCDEDCIMEAADPGSSTAAIAANWSAGQTCIYCRAPLKDDPVAGHRTAFLDTDGLTHEWTDLPAERLQDALRGAWPVCWSCHVIATFRREHPQLVTDRSNISHH